MWASSKLSLLLLLVGCGLDLGPTGNVNGTWYEPFMIPGSSFALILTQHATQITGTGSWSGEACCDGTMQVAGSYTPRPDGARISLSLHYDDGAVRSYVGTVQDDSHIDGRLDGVSLLLIRQ